VQTAFDKHNAFINDKEGFHIRVLRNNSIGKQIIKRLPGIKKIRDEFNELLDEVLKKATVKILPYPTINTGAIFKKYLKAPRHLAMERKRKNSRMLSQ
jgi:hypothetical protein